MAISKTPRHFELESLANCSYNFLQRLCLHLASRIQTAYFSLYSDRKKGHYIARGSLFCSNIKEKAGYVRQVYIIMVVMFLPSVNLIMNTTE